MPEGTTAVNSYDAGHQPYVHDPKRGKWESQWDFYSTFFASTFGMQKVILIATVMHLTGGIYIIVALLIGTFLYVIPVFFLQSFMGQFSSTGYISVFRISPLFKGIGYVTLALNFTYNLYSSSATATAFLFFLKSFQLNTTWMYCDNAWNSPNCTIVEDRGPINNLRNENTSYSVQPIYEYYYHGIMKLSYDPSSYEISWSIAVAQLFIWIMIGIVVYRGIGIVGKFLRYTTLLMTIIAIIFFIRLCFLPEFAFDLIRFFKPPSEIRMWHVGPWIMASILCAEIVDRGWGTTLTMASYQPFRKNIENYSYIIPLGMVFVTMVFALMTSLADGFIRRRVAMAIDFFDRDAYEYVFLAMPYLFGSMEASQMWSMLFYLMTFLSDLCSHVIITFSMLTALFDEYVPLRGNRSKLVIGLCTGSYLLSTMFASEYLSIAFVQLLKAHYASRIFICLLEIMIVVWIYGRERFLRDVRFILIKNIPASKFYILRFVAPVFIIISVLFYTAHALVHARMEFEPLYLHIIALIAKGLPWIFIPGYIIIKLVTTIGTFRERFRKCTRPTDWYPADPADKHKYDLALGTSEVSQNLLEMNDNNVP